MALTTIKSTASLDVETVPNMEVLAKRWNVPESDVLRRAIRITATNERLDESAKLAALDRLQASLCERKVDISQWARDCSVVACQDFMIHLAR